ncbi:MAG: protein-L-isoaspartate O-methyltransferase family protein [Thermoplasmata archaeon]
MRGWGDRLKREGYLHSEAHVDVFNRVKREDFVDEGMRAFSFTDEPIPITHGQTQSAPHMNAIFVDHINPREEDQVLEIGTGSGYLTAILSLLSKRVVTVEYFYDLAHSASGRIARYSKRNVDVICGNINQICFRAKFDAIISTASFRKEPSYLLSFLKDDGRIIFPLGGYPPQRLIKIEGGKREDLGYVSFVTIID